MASPRSVEMAREWATKNARRDRTPGAEFLAGDVWCHVDDLVALLDQRAEEERKRGWNYPHMCRDGHPEIGHALSDDDERCPVCRERDRADAAAEEARREERERAARIVRAVAADCWSLGTGGYPEILRRLREDKA